MEINTRTRKITLKGNEPTAEISDYRGEITQGIDSNLITNISVTSNSEIITSDICLLREDYYDSYSVPISVVAINNGSIKKLKTYGSLDILISDGYMGESVVMGLFKINELAILGLDDLDNYTYKFDIDIPKNQLSYNTQTINILDETDLYLRKEDYKTKGINGESYFTECTLVSGKIQSMPILL